MKKSKPLIFRNRAIGGTMYAQRNKVVYKVRYSTWFEGKELEAKYYVRYWDTVNKVSFDTLPVRRFLTSEEAQGFCQDIYEGKIDVLALEEEVNAYFKEINDRNNKASFDKAEWFKGVLSEADISLSVFLALAEAWNQVEDSSRRLLYEENDKRKKCEEGCVEKSENFCHQ